MSLATSSSKHRGHLPSSNPLLILFNFQNPASNIATSLLSCLVQLTTPFVSFHNKIPVGPHRPDDGVGQHLWNATSVRLHGAIFQEAGTVFLHVITSLIDLRVQLKVANSVGFDKHNITFKLFFQLLYPVGLLSYEVFLLLLKILYTIIHCETHYLTPAPHLQLGRPTCWISGHTWLPVFLQALPQISSISFRFNMNLRKTYWQWDKRKTNDVASSFRTKFRETEHVGNILTRWPLIVPWHVKFVRWRVTNTPSKSSDIF